VHLAGFWWLDYRRFQNGEYPRTQYTLGATSSSVKASYQFLSPFRETYLLPSSPDKARFLTQKDQHIALVRILREHKETTTERPTLKHVYRALFNVNNPIHAVGFFFSNVAVQSLALFMPTILFALGWTALKTQFYTVPVYTVACCYTIFITYVSDRLQRRGLILMLNNVITITGFAILISAKSNSVKYFAVYLAGAGGMPTGPVYLAWALGNAAGPSIRAVTGAYIVAAAI
jgi:hypothetical protein